MGARYWAAAAGSLLRHSVRTPGFAAELGRSGLVLDARPRAPQFPLPVAVPGSDRLTVDMGSMSWNVSNIDPVERFSIGAILQLCRPARVFEIGTFDGSTTLFMARNAPGAHVFTLDLPPAVSDRATVDSEADNAAAGVGSKFGGTTEAERITQLFGDSRSFDFSPWYGTVDVVLVDGGHTGDCVGPDTANAFRLVAPDGVIIWDDYMTGWPDVVRAVDGHRLDEGWTLAHIAGTDLVLAHARPWGRLE